MTIRRARIPGRAWIVSSLLGAMLAGTQVARGWQLTPPLPDRDAFLARVHAQLRTDEELESQYTYLENRQEISIGKLGKVQLGDVRLFEVYPSLDPDQTYRRLIAVNGVPLDPKALRERDEVRRKALADRADLLARETSVDRAHRERKEAEARQQQQDIIEDVFRVYEVTLVGRNIIDGHRVIVATMTPRAGASPRSQPGKYFPKVGGTAWVSEDDYRVVKVQFEALSDISVGWGVVGRIDKGSQLTLERQRVNEDVWSASRTTIEMTGRTLLVRSFSVKAVTEFSDYNKLGVQPLSGARR